MYLDIARVNQYRGRNSIKKSVNRNIAFCIERDILTTSIDKNNTFISSPSATHLAT